MSNYNWYKEKNHGLDYSKPIVAERDDGNIELLLPGKDKGLYQIIGYDWFNLGTGEWQSCTTWSSPMEAVHNRKGHTIYNVEIAIKRLNNE